MSKQTLFTKPELNTFQLTKNGHKVASYEIKRYTLFMAKLTGYAALRGLEITLDAIDEMAYGKQNESVKV